MARPYYRTPKGQWSKFSYNAKLYSLKGAKIAVGHLKAQYLRQADELDLLELQELDKAYEIEKACI